MKVFVDGGRPIKSWAEDVEEGALAQAANLSRLPFVMGHVALMPDAHQGYGMPVGGVFMADRAVVPYAVGVDIGCGVTLIDTDVPGLSDEDVAALLHQVSRDVPVGNGPRGAHKERGEPFPIPGDGRTAAVVNDAEAQLGTLGGGNHFLELQRDEDDRVAFMIHSGSRSVGKKLCDFHHRVALRMNERWHSALPDRELAWLPWDSDEARSYWADMTMAMAWAEENRRRMAGAVIAAFGSVLGAKAWQALDVHHNYASWEQHGGKGGIVHRKGAVRARVGDAVLVPGSMSTASYVGEGLGNPDAFETCQHGAGRARSRAATRRMLTLEGLEESMAGVLLLTPDRAGVIDEAAIAYKDIESVMAASADLVRPTRRLVPLGVVKG